MASTRAPSNPRSANSTRAAARIEALVLAELRGRLAVSALGFDASAIAGEEGSDTSVYRRNGHQDGGYDDQADNSRDGPGKERGRIATGQRQSTPQVEVEQIAQDDAEHHRRHRIFHLAQDEAGNA